MKRKTLFNLAAILAVMLALVSSTLTIHPVRAQGAVGTAFTYQGRLSDGSSPANGSYDFEFRLYSDPEAEGSQVGDPAIVDDQAVSNGLFTVQLDFQAVFDGEGRYLEIRVRPGSSTGEYTVLSPRQELTAAPYALYALDVATHDHWGESWSGAGTGLTLSGGNVGLSGSGLLRGVHGLTSSSSGIAVYGENTGGGHGIHGTTNSLPEYSAVQGVNWGSGNGVSGISSSGHGIYGYSASEYGVFGLSSSVTNAGVFGHNTSSGPGVFGSADYYGVYGSTSNLPGYAVYGENIGGGDSIYGTTNSVAGFAAVRGENGGGGSGVSGTSSSGHGVYGYSVSEYGVYGLSSSSTNAGVYGHNASDGPGVYGTSTSGYAGYFSGNVLVTGNLSKGSGSFKIDHPLDPQNQYLYHSFVESPDMMNVYNGNVILGDSGEAWVELPAWFDALNKDFRYQLTSLGAPGPNLYIAEEIAHNRFKIAGGTPGLKVSWQVTGIRHDPYAEANRIPIEEAKPPEEQGTCLHPEACGQSATDGLGAETQLPGGAE